MVLFRITRTLLNKTYLINVLEYQKMGIILGIQKTNCDIDKFFLEQEKIKINNIQENINNGNITETEINELIANIHKYCYKNKI